MESTSPSDEDLARALQAGDDTALDELVRRYQRPVFAVAYRMTFNREDALDIAQDVFLKAFRKIDTWHASSRFKPWLMRLAVNHSIDFLRRRKGRWHQPLDEDWSPDGANAMSVPGPDAQARAGEIEARVRQALSALSPAQRQVFVLRHYEGLALAEIAESLGCTVGSVKVHLFRALKKLQHELRDMYEP